MTKHVQWFCGWDIFVKVQNCSNIITFTWSQSSNTFFFCTVARGKVNWRTYCCCQKITSKYLFQKSKISVLWAFQLKPYDECQWSLCLWTFEILNSFLYVMSPTTTRVGSSGNSSCPHCSQTIAEANISIKCDKCGYWVHLKCTIIPLKPWQTEGVFWFCNECTKSVRKIVKMKSYTDTEFREEVSRSLTEVKSSLQKLEAKYHPDLPNIVDSDSDIKNVERKYASTDTNLKKKSSRV